MKVEVYLRYMSVENAARFSPILFQILKKLGVEVEIKQWDGTEATIPTEKPVIIYSRGTLHCPIELFTRRCGELGHLPWYDDVVVVSDGGKPQNLYEAISSFMERVGRHQE